MKTIFKNEIKKDLELIKELIDILKDKEIAVSIKVAGNDEYWIEKNKHAIQMLKKERKLLKKKLNWKI